MWDIRSIVLFICSLLVVILLSLSTANANGNKLSTTISEVPNKVGNFITSEVQNTKEYQKKTWSEVKTKWPWNVIFKGNSDE